MLFRTTNINRRQQKIDWVIGFDFDKGPIRKLIVKMKEKDETFLYFDMKFGTDMFGREVFVSHIIDYRPEASNSFQIKYYPKTKEKEIIKLNANK